MRSVTPAFLIPKFQVATGSRKPPYTAQTVMQPTLCIGYMSPICFQPEKRVY